MRASAHFAMAIERLDGSAIDAIAYVAAQAAAGYNLVVHSLVSVYGAARLTVQAARFFSIVTNRKPDQ
jgi:hypothetical protein